MSHRPEVGPARARSAAALASPEAHETARAADLFTRHFGEAAGAMVSRAPGRVNLIGEHTDSDDGFVLPLTIDHSVEAVPVALDNIFDMRMGAVETAELCRDVEHEFAGVRSGIMDQFASRIGQPGHALFIDWRTLEVRQFPVRFEDFGFAVIDTGVRRDLGDSRHNQRRGECEEALDAIRRLDPVPVSLRDVSLELLETGRSEMSDVLHARCRHVIGENTRVADARRCLARGDDAAFGLLMNASHASLRDDFDVSHPALDRVIDAATVVDGVHGSRLTGAGFGGCTLHLVAAASQSDFERTMQPILDELPGSSILWIGTPECAGVKEIIN